MDLRPSRGGFLRPFGAGWFIREFLLGNGPENSTRINPSRGAAQSDINYEYKEALARATAQDRAERIISRVVLSGTDVSEEQAERIYDRELKRVSRKAMKMSVPRCTRNSGARKNRKYSRCLLMNLRNSIMLWCIHPD